MGSLKSSLFSSDKVTRDNLDRGWYGSVLSNMALFRRAGGKTDDLSATDTPGHFYFKIFFYFDNPGEDGGMFSSNFLSLAYNSQSTGMSSLPWKNQRSGGITEDAFTSENGKKSSLVSSTNSASANSALNYLLLNNELERAEKLTKFISILSNISTYSPWYFTEISGLDAAIERKEATERDFKIDETRRQINIKCLSDAYDTRIGTLLDLYRDITYSYQLHKEIVPANLRKFDMGIYIFNAPIKNIHGKDAKFAKFVPDGGSEYGTSYKYIELQNCEIDYNSSKAAYATLNNSEGMTMENSIIISYDTAMERRYNEIIMREIGDFTRWDIDCSLDPDYQKDDAAHYEEFKKRLTAYKSRGILAESVNQAITSAFSQAEGFINSIALGNLHAVNVTGIVSNAERIASGNVFGGVSGMVQQTKTMKEKESEELHPSVGKSLHRGSSPRTARAAGWTQRKFSGYPEN